MFAEMPDFAALAARRMNPDRPRLAEALACVLGCGDAEAREVVARTAPERLRAWLAAPERAVANGAPAGCRPIERPAAA